MLPRSIILCLSALAVMARATTSTTLAPRATTASGHALTTTSSSSPSTSTTTAVTTHSIAVGANGMKFEPANITNAAVGDIIEWRFYPTGHWVVRSEFDQACIPYEDTGPNKVGFSSGPIDVATTSNNGPAFQIQINDTNPLFFYCAAPDSCTRWHMVGVINPNSTQTYAKQLESAENAAYQMTPGEAFPSETASSSSSSSTPADSSNASSHSHPSLSPGAIAGISIGGAAVVILGAVLLYLCGRRGGKDSAFARRQSQATTLDGPFQDPRYGGGVPVGSKSPGQETFHTATYSLAPSIDPYQTQPHARQYGGQPHGVVPASYSVSSASPPPMSEYSVQTGFFAAPSAPGQQQLLPHDAPQAAPVELPTSLDPGSSPLPAYNNGARGYSWAQGGEGTYRPSKP